MSLGNWRVGDKVERAHPPGKYVYFFVGFTRQGKARFRRAVSGSEMTTWWQTPSQIPGFRGSRGTRTRYFITERGKGPEVPCPEHLRRR